MISLYDLFNHIQGFNVIEYPAPFAVILNQKMLHPHVYAAGGGVATLYGKCSLLSQS